MAIPIDSAMHSNNGWLPGKVVTYMSTILLVKIPNHKKTRNKMAGF